MSLQGWLLFFASVFVVYIILVVTEFWHAALAHKAVGVLVFLVPLLKPQFWLIALPLFGLVFWATFKRVPGPR